MAIIILANQANSVCINSELSTTTGNARGSGSTDLQTKRTGATQVASGNYSFIGGGQSNIASGANAFVGGGTTNTASVTSAIVCGGSNNTASTGIYATVCGGYLNTASGQKSAILGGQSNAASGSFSMVCGGYKAVANKYGQLAHASGRFTAAGDAQRCAYVLRISTTTNTQAELFLDGVGGRLVLENDSTWAFDGLLVCRRTDVDGTNSAWTVSGVIKRDTNAASTALVGTSTPVLIQQDAGAAATAVDVTADTTNGSLRFRVTGEAAKTYNFVLYLRTVEVTG